jgi:hypothetical protein
VPAVRVGEALTMHDSKAADADCLLASWGDLGFCEPIEDLPAALRVRVAIGDSEASFASLLLSSYLASLLPLGCTGEMNASKGTKRERPVVLGLLPARLELEEVDGGEVRLPLPLLLLECRVSLEFRELTAGFALGFGIEVVVDRDSWPRGELR